MGGGITFACPECGALYYRISHSCEEPEKKGEEEE
jgi:predicted RNA-binding Zn-ribbon protein involved in translation (DUF1610 family)